MIYQWKLKSHVSPRAIWAERIELITLFWFNIHLIPTLVILQKKKKHWILWLSLILFLLLKLQVYPCNSSLSQYRHFQFKNIKANHPKTILVRRNRLNVKIESERIDCVSRQSTVLLSSNNCFFFFLPISTSSRDSSHWLGAQNAASALCCGSGERLGMGQRWHRQRDAGKVWSPKKNINILQVI